jgi:hypothetical protein
LSPDNCALMGWNYIVKNRLALTYLYFAVTSSKCGI